MQFSNISLALRASVAAITLLLAACGGSSSYGGGDDGLTQDQRDDRAASASIAGLLAFALAQIAATSDTAEPRSIGGITPQVSETDEPSPLSP